MLDRGLTANGASISSISAWGIPVRTCPVTENSSNQLRVNAEPQAVGIYPRALKTKQITYQYDLTTIAISLGTVVP